MNIEGRVKRIERWIAAVNLSESKPIIEAIRRDLAAEEAAPTATAHDCGQTYVASLGDTWDGAFRSMRNRRDVPYAQVADLTRERDQARGALSVCGIDLRAARDEASAIRAELLRKSAEFAEALLQAVGYGRCACGRWCLRSYGPVCVVCEIEAAKTVRAE